MSKIFSLDSSAKYSLLAGMPAVVKKEHVSYLNPQDHIINYKLYD